MNLTKEVEKREKWACEFKKNKKQVRNKTSTHFWEKWEIWLFTLRLIKDTACSGSVRDFDWWIAKNSSGGEGLGLKIDAHDQTFWKYVLELKITSLYSNEIGEPIPSKEHQNVLGMV